MTQTGRIQVSLDDESRADLTKCMTAYALENNGQPVTFSKVIAEALKRYAATVDLPVKPPRKGRA